MNAIAAIFLRRTGADGLGHAGWAFDCGDGTFCTGSVENPRHSLRTGARQMGFWMLRTADPIAPMRQRHYTDLKVIEIDQPDADYAWHVAAWASHQHYAVFGHNCMNVAYDILRAYGAAGLPAPAHHWEPNHWFDHAPGQPYQIEERAVALESRAHGPTFVGASLPDRDSLVVGPLHQIEPAMPPWRTKAAPEWIALEAAIATAPPMPANQPAPAATPYHRLLAWLWRRLHRSPH
jgi:hypothetical protein